MAQEMNILYERDEMKMKLPKFRPASISINDNAISDPLSPVGNLGEIHKDDTFYMSMTSFVYMAYDETETEVTLNSPSDEYVFRKFHALEQPTNLPPGIVCSADSEGFELTGSVFEINNYQFEFLLRVTLETWDKAEENLIRVDVFERYFYFTTNITKDTFYWDESWLDGQMTQEIDGQKVYYLGTWPKGVNINLPTVLYNPNNIKVSYTTQATGFSGGLSSNETVLPKGLKIDPKQGNIGGSISLSNSPGNYFFKIAVSHEQYLGTPPTNSIIFLVKIQNLVSTVATPDNSILWTTPPGNIGTSYSSYSVHFQIEAKNPSGKKVEYSIAPNGYPLPGNLSIDADTGMIIGNCPFVDIPTTYNFTGRASLGSNYIDRNFSFTVLPLNGASNYMNVNIPITEHIRELITPWAWNLDAIPEDIIYRPFDPNFARTTNPQILLAAGLNADVTSIGYWFFNKDRKEGQPKNNSVYSEPDLRNTREEDWHSILTDKLRGYHRPFRLRIGKIKWSPAYDPAGVYLYDVIYYEVYDPNKDQLAFTNGVENIYSNPTGSLMNNSFTKDVNLEHSYFQVPDGKTTREYPVCLMNCRLDLIYTKNRIKSPTYYRAPNATAGFGIDGKENLPFWMLNSPSTDQSVPPVGWKPVIPLAYVLPGKGSVVAVNLEQLGAENQVTGQEFIVDRYVVDIAIHKWIIWDFDMNPTTTFDNQNRPWIRQTLFDVRSEYTERVVLFPRIGTE